MVGFETKIKNLCRANNVTQKQLYESLGISDAGMRKMFARNSCEVSFLEKIAAYFHVPVCYFFDEEKQSAVASGDSSIAVNNITGNIEAGDTSALQERVKLLEQLLAERERIIEEKERTIKILMER